MRKCGLLLTSLAFLLLVPSLVWAQGALILEIPDGRYTIPGDCSHWHEVYPVYCGGYHQVMFDDLDENDEVSEGDQAWLNAAGATPCLLYTILGVQPIYHTLCDDRVFEPQNWEPGNPVCQTWMEIHPDYGVSYHVETWSDDNQSGEVDEGDTVTLSLDETILECYIEEWQIGCDAVGPIPVEESTWSRVKRLFLPF